MKPSRSPTPSKRLPEPVSDAIYWLNASGRGLVADALALWVASPISNDLLERLDKIANDQHVFPYLRDDCREAAQVIRAWHEASERWEGQREELYAELDDARKL